MFATATTHLPHPCSVVADLVLGDLDTHVWLPELHRLDDRRLDEAGARSRLQVRHPGWPDVVELTTRRVARSTVTAAGAAADGREVSLCLSLSAWHGGTAVVLSVDVDGRDRPLLSWGLARRLEDALVRLGGQVSLALSPAGATRT